MTQQKTRDTVSVGKIRKGDRLNEDWAKKGAKCLPALPFWTGIHSYLPISHPERREKCICLLKNRVCLTEKMSLCSSNSSLTGWAWRAHIGICSGSLGGGSQLYCSPSPLPLALVTPHLVDPSPGGLSCLSKAVWAWPCHPTPPLALPLTYPLLHLSLQGNWPKVLGRKYVFPHSKEHMSFLET